MKFDKKLIFELLIVLGITLVIILGGIYLPAGLLKSKINNLEDYSNSVKSDAVQPYGEDTLALEAHLIDLINDMENMNAETMQVGGGTSYEGESKDRTQFSDELLRLVSENYSYNLRPTTVQNVNIPNTENDFYRITDIDEDLNFKVLMSSDVQSGIVVDSVMRFSSFNLKYSNFWQEIRTLYSQEVGMTFLDSQWGGDNNTLYTFEAVTVDGRLGLTMDLTATPNWHSSSTEIATGYYSYDYVVVIKLIEK